MGRSAFSLLATSVALAIALTACGGSGNGGGNGSSARYGTGLTLESGTLNTARVGAAVAPWVVWNPHSCSFQQTNDHPAEYRAVVRPAKDSPRIGYMHYGNTDPFGVANSKSIEEWASKAGMSLDVYNLKFPSRTEPLANARTAIVKGDRGVIQANLDPTILPAFYKVLEGDGCIPSIQLYIPVRGHPAMGNNWPDVGKEIGRAVARLAGERGWKPQDTALVQCTDPSSGPTVDVMFRTIPEQLDAAGFAIPAANKFNLVCKADETQSGFKEVTDWFTSHPDFKHVALTAVDTVRIPHMIRAAKQQDIPREAWIAAAGADDESSRAAVRKGDQDISIAFFGERFGEWAIPMLQDIMAGKPVPSVLGTELVPLTRGNIGQYYPAGA